MSKRTTAAWLGNPSLTLPSEADTVGMSVSECAPGKPTLAERLPASGAGPGRVRLMRILVIEDAEAVPLQASVQPLVQQLVAAGKLSGATQVCGWSSDTAEQIGRQAPDVLLVNSLPDHDPTRLLPFLDAGLPALAMGSWSGLETWLPLVQKYPLSLLPLSATSEAVWAALVSVYHAFRRERGLQDQVNKLQQRLSDRIVIEKAKGLLIQTLGLSEDEAYRRLRVESRRQRKKIREIAQSLLDSRFIWQGPAPPSEPAAKQLPRTLRTAAPGESRSNAGSQAEREGA